MSKEWEASTTMNELELGDRYKRKTGSRIEF